MTGHLVAALSTAGCGPTSVALDQLVGLDPSVAFDVVYVLRVVGLQYAFILQQLDESVCR